MDKVIIDGTEYKLKELPSYEIGGYHNPVISFRGKNYVAKAIKKEVEKDYEILEIDYSNAKKEVLGYSNIQKRIEYGAKIKTVKRLSDNTVWTIGDKVYWAISDMEKFSGNVINEFYTDPLYGNMRVKGAIPKPFDIPFSQIKRDERNPLLYADNGKTPIYEGDEFWLVSETQFYLIGQTANVDYEPYYADKKFSTVQLANEYLLMNKPILSLNDLLSVWGDVRSLHHEDSPMFLKFKELAKQKIKI